MAVSFDPKFIRFSRKADVQNLLPYSEQLNTAPWSGMTVTTNTGTDLEGNTTLDTLTATGAWQTHGTGNNITVVANTQYTWSFDAQRGTQGTHFYVEFYDDTNAAVIQTTDFISQTSTSVQRVVINVTMPTGCVAMSAYFMWTASGDNMKIGRVQFALPGKEYIETTSTPVP